MCTVELLEFIERFHCICTGIIIIVYTCTWCVYIQASLVPRPFFAGEGKLFLWGDIFSLPAKKRPGNKAIYRHTVYV